MHVTFPRLPDHQRAYSLVERDDGVVYRRAGGVAGPWLPPDIVHLVVERELRIEDGLWGGIAAGAVLCGGLRAQLLTDLVAATAALDAPTPQRIRALAARLAALPDAEVDPVVIAAAAQAIQVEAARWARLRVGDQLDYYWPDYDLLVTRPEGRPPELIEAGQLTLRRWRPADAGALYQAVTESLDHLSPWMDWAPGYTSAAAAEYVAAKARDWRSGAGFGYAITVAGAIVGSCELMARIGPGALELGYWVHPGYTRRGLASAAALALAEQGLALPGIDRVEIHHDPGNAASAGVARKLGCTLMPRADDSQDWVWFLASRR